MEKKKYDSTVARIAGNLLSGAFTSEEFARIGRIGMTKEQREAVDGAVNVAQYVVITTEVADAQARALPDGR